LYIAIIPERKKIVKRFFAKKLRAEYVLNGAKRLFMSKKIKKGRTYAATI